VKLSVLAVLLLAGAVSAVFALRSLPVQSLAVPALEWIRAAGIRGALIYSVLYIAATVLFVPPAFLNTAAGFVWGAMFGIAVVYPANVVAAVIAFFLGRFLARDFVAKYVARSRYLSALDSAVHRAGLKFVFLLRLSPFFPFATLNYLLGLSRIRGRDYVLASLGTLPGTFLCVSLGALLNQAAEVFMGATLPNSAWQHAVLWLGVLGGLAAFALLAGNTYLELRRVTAGKDTQVSPGASQS
jgi:uncharacterized membrane protein YdjX (TVP38/TMEM64 family)